MGCEQRVIEAPLEWTYDKKGRRLRERDSEADLICASVREAGKIIFFG
jgi:hypothetical protein